ncbi:colanic acid biosynthesis glycosyltransferase WcaE [Stakelama sediminis]|uniref:Putative colanic acid biosynthesis glycosyltransferase n=1 Tax=Stakelama sediminis TaxID=463200 RepID=A0A840Z3V1_9SPHN|nr:glycosyltransferase family 2 protein [Stakelama sediminis]MBB5720356.1 putative colanic acid biosynthesis glycosyltransferase [Stakelama sediminis]
MTAPTGRTHGPPKFSIVTIVRNNAEGFEATRRSVLDQNSCDFEWIVVDGASTDKTLHLVETAFASGEAHGFSEPDRGIYDAMNKGLKAATGDYIVFLNAGDRLLESDSLQIVADAIDQAGQPDVAFFASKMTFGQKVIDRPAKSPNYIWHGQPGLHQATFFRREVHLQHPFSDRYRICGDYDVLARLRASGARMQSFPQVIGNNSFDADATSGRHKLRLIKEAVQIQRSELHLPLWKCTASVLFRSMNSFVFKLLTQINRRTT